MVLNIGWVWCQLLGLKVWGQTSCGFEDLRLSSNLFLGFESNSGMSLDQQLYRIGDVKQVAERLWTFETRDWMMFMVWNCMLLVGLRVWNQLLCEMGDLLRVGIGRIQRFITKFDGFRVWDQQGCYVDKNILLKMILYEILKAEVLNCTREST